MDSPKLALRGLIPALAVPCAWLGVASTAYAETETSHLGSRIAVVWIVLLCLFFQAGVVGFVLAALRRPAKKLRFTLVFAGTATALIAAAFPFFSWRPVLYVTFGLIAFLVAETSTRSRSPAPKEPAPAPDESV